MNSRIAIVAVAAAVGASLPAVAADAAPTCFGRPATIVGTRGDDELDGTPERDVIYAGRGRDLIRARGGDDLVCGGAGTDSLLGDDGADRLSGGKGFVDDHLEGGSGPDRLLPGCSGEEGDYLYGNAGADHLLGSCGRTEMFPGPGDDVVRSTRGQVYFTTATAGIVVDLAKGVATGEGRDRIRLTTKDDAESWEVTTIVGTEFDDRLEGGPGQDAFEGGRGDDVVRGRGGDDFLSGTGGADSVSGGRGRDTFQMYDGTVAVGGRGGDSVVCEPRFEHETASFDGGPGSDWELFMGLPSEATVDLGAGTSTCSLTYASTPPSTVVMELSLTGVENVSAAAPTKTLDATGSDARNVIVGSRGADEIDTLAGDDEIAAGGGPDEVDAGDGDDTASGGKGHDTLLGQGGDDRLDGDEGSDTVDGGDGTDTCSGETRERCERP